MITLIHGRAPKPSKPELEALWFEALRRSVKTSTEFAESPKQMVYYGDLSNHFWNQPCPDIETRRALLDSLEKADFRYYPGETAYGIQEPPEDILAYWDSDSDFSRTLTERVQKGLACLPPGPSLVIAHSLGVVLVSDGLVALPPEARQMITLITLGSPLTLPHFRKRSPLPSGLAAWHNVCARGDLVCGPTPQGAHHHDIINPLLKELQPDPHHALGYLRHPLVGELVSRWLESA